MTERTYSTFEVARLCGVGPVTVANWARNYRLPARRTLGGHRRFRRADLVAFLDRQGFPVPAPLREKRMLVVLASADAPQLGVARQAFGLHPGLFELLSFEDPAHALLAVGRRAPSLMLVDLDDPGLDWGPALSVLRRDPATRDVALLAASARPLSAGEKRSLRSKRCRALAKPLSVYGTLLGASKVLGMPPPKADGTF